MAKDLNGLSQIQSLLNIISHYNHIVSSVGLQWLLYHFILRAPGIAGLTKTNIPQGQIQLGNVEFQTEHKRLPPQFLCLFIITWEPKAVSSFYFFSSLTSSLLGFGTGWILTYGFLVSVSPLKAATYLSFVSSFLFSSPRYSASLSWLTLPIIWSSQHTSPT